MTFTPLVLGLLAVVLAGPIPAMMARARRLHLTAFASLVLWQAVALAAVLAALGAGLSLATTPTLHEQPGPFVLVVAVVAVLLTALVLVRLLLSGHRVGTALRSSRRDHREQVDLVAGRQDDLRVLEHEVPVAYCLPGIARSRVVISAGALSRLDHAQLSAVLAHERAHLAARHDLVLEAFTVLHCAFPRWVSSDAALREVQLLVEILADRAALRVGRAHDLGAALMTMARGRVPVGSLGTTGSDLVERVRVLADPRPRRGQQTLLILTSWAVLILPTSLVVAPWLTGLNS